MMVVKRWFFFSNFLFLSWPFTIKRFFFPPLFCLSVFYYSLFWCSDGPRFGSWECVQDGPVSFDLFSFFLGQTLWSDKEDISSCFPRSGFESFPSSDLKTAVALRAGVPFTGERVLEIKAWMIGLLITTWNYCFWALLSRQSEVNVSGFIHPSSYLSSVYTDASNMSL